MLSKALFVEKEIHLISSTHLIILSSSFISLCRFVPLSQGAKIEYLGGLCRG
jgi:hypothetical protein